MPLTRRFDRAFWLKYSWFPAPEGGLLKFLGNHIELDNDEVELLNDSVTERNFLAHDYWYRRSSLLATPAGCEKLVAELRQMSERLKKANSIAERISGHA